MANVIYNAAKSGFMKGTFNLDSDTLKVALFTSSYTPNIDTDVYYGDLSNEVSGVGYVTGGTALTGGTVTIDTTNDRGVYDADDVLWGTSSITARGAVLYKATGTAANSPLIGYFDFSTDQSSSSGNFAVTWGTAGIINFG